MNKKVLLVSAILSIFVFLGINMLFSYFTDSWYDIEIAKRPEVLTASVSQGFLENQLQDLKDTRQRAMEIKNAGVDSRAIISVQISRDGGERVLLSYNSQDRVAIASLTKLMTALVVFDNYDLDASIEITQKAVDREGNGHLAVGQKVSVNDLLNTMLIESNNDAGHALTELIGFEAFVDLMNLTAQKIGLENTYYVNPTGLEPDDPEAVKNYSTAEDLVKLTKYILEKRPEIFEITTNPDGNTNKLLAKYPGIIGGKTGYSPAAGECLLVVLKNGTKLYINVILGTQNRFAEMSKIIDIIYE